MIGSVITMAATGFIAGLGLMYASKKFHVEKDERIEKINEMLPAANCGGCGLPGCMALAEAIVKGKAAPDACPVGGTALAKQIAVFMGGMQVNTGVKKVARIRCNGGDENGIEKYEYYGPRDCNSVTLLAGGGNKVCTYGCVGEGGAVLNHAASMLCLWVRTVSPPVLDLTSVHHAASA